MNHIFYSYALPTKMSDLKIFNPSNLSARHRKIHITIPIIAKTFPLNFCFLPKLTDLQYFKINNNWVLRNRFAVHFNTINFGRLQSFYDTYSKRKLQTYRVSKIEIFKPEWVKLFTDVTLYFPSTIFDNIVVYVGPKQWNNL